MPMTIHQQPLYRLLSDAFVDLAAVAAQAADSRSLPAHTRELAETVRHLALAIASIEQSGAMASPASPVPLLLRDTFKQLAMVSDLTSTEDEPLVKLRELLSSTATGEPVTAAFKAECLALVSAALLNRTNALFEGYKLAARYSRRLIEGSD